MIIFRARYYDPVLGIWKSIDPLWEKYRGWSPYNYVLNNPLRFIDPDGKRVDDYLIKENGTIQLNKTDDKFDRFFIENSMGESEFVGQFNKNANNLVQLPRNFSFQGLDGKSFGWASHTDDMKRFLSGAAVGALIGALYETGTNDISIGQFSYSDGTSPSPSTSHKFGRNGDLRPLRSVSCPEIG